MGVVVTIKISVALCTYNRFEYLPLALDSLIGQTLSQEDFEVIIVDNSDDLEAADVFWAARSLPQNTHLIRTSPPGLSRARNIAYEAAQSPIVAYLDDDAIANENWLANFVAYFERNEDIGVAGGPIEPIWPQKEPEWLPQSLLGCLTILDLGEQDVRLDQGAHCFGANLAFRKRALEMVGGFDTSVGRTGGSSLLSNEEIIVQNEISSLEGFEKGYCASARVRHHVDKSRLSKNWFRSRLAWQAVSEILPGDAGGYSAQWNAAMLRSSAKALGIEHFLHKFMNPANAQEFEQYLYFMRHFIGEMLNAKNIDDQVYQDLIEPKADVSPSEIAEGTPNAETVESVLVPGIGSEKPHVFAEFNPGHRYLFDAYGLSEKTHLVLLNENPWLEPINYSLQELAKTLTQQNETLTFLTLDPFIATSQISVFRQFVLSQKIPVFGFLHRLPTSAAELQNLKTIAKEMAGVFVLSEPFLALVQSSTQLENIYYIPHHPSKFPFKHVAKNCIREELGIPQSKVVVSLIGELRKHKGIEVLLRSLSHLTPEAKNRLAFLVAGKSTHYNIADIEEAFSSQGCSLYAFSGEGSKGSYIFLNAKRFTELLKVTDVGLLLYGGAQKNLTSGILSDFIDYEKSVIATADSVTGHDVTKYNLGFVVAEDNAESLATVLNNLHGSTVKFQHNPSYQLYRDSISPEKTVRQLVSFLDNAIIKPIDRE